MLFSPTRDEVRHFFCEAWRKWQSREPLTQLETLATDWIIEHPEYHGDLDSTAQAATARYPIESGRTNPFLHLSMHLSIAEQLQIDQPAGIRAVFEHLRQRLGSTHEAAHQVMECLGEVLWKAQRDRSPPDGEAYLECMRRRSDG
jgi:hypothetical protein